MTQLARQDVTQMQHPSEALSMALDWLYIKLLLFSNGYYAKDIILFDRVCEVERSRTKKEYLCERRRRLHKYTSQGRQCSSPQPTPVDGRQALLFSICLHLCQLFICAEAWVHQPIIYKLVYILLIQLLPLRLSIWAVRSADIWPCNVRSI